tara:strand:+ start:16986 stop:17546 length:561 start_codon:yes stop_codon:yes gene_type:complete
VIEASGKNQLVILDRDGVINQDSKDFIKSEKEWIPIPGSIDAIASLSNSGFIVAIATNQSGIARNLFGFKELEAMHQKLHSLVSKAGGHIAKIIVCPHGPDENSDCRKPKPKMLNMLIEEYGNSSENVYAIGDSMRDLEAAFKAGVTPILVRTGNGLKTEKNLPSKFSKIRIYDDLAKAAMNMIKA